jgi:hypothetical protein
MPTKADQAMPRPRSGSPISGGRAFCPSCQYDLSATIVAGLSRCPECGSRFEAKLLLAGKYEQRHRYKHGCQDDPRYPILGIIMCAFFLLLLVLSVTS